MHLRKVLLGITTCLLLLPVTYAHAQGSGPLRVGLLSTLSGPAAVIGANGKAGIEMAAREINERGGIAGRQIELVFADDQLDPTAAVNEARRLVQSEKVNAVVGLVSGQVVQATIPVFNEAKILNLSITGLAAATPAFAPYHFSLLVSGDLHGLATARYLKDVVKAKRVAILTDDTPTAKESVASFKKALERSDTTIVAEQSFQTVSTDMTPALLSLRRASPDIIYLLTAHAPSIANIIGSRNDLNWDVPILGNVLVVLYPSAKAKLGQNAYRNTQGMYYKSFTYCPGENVAQSPYAKFFARLKQAIGEDGLKKLTPALIAQQYDQLFVLKAAIEGSGGKTDGPTLAAWIEQNAEKIPPLVSTSSRPNKDNHFFIGVDDIVFIKEPGDPDEHGMRVREGCK